jgi:TfoX/Sxy family transcriptional regulator of competence genes
VAYDEDLADRVRALLDGEPGLTERRMFGGLAFMVGGHMAVCASGEGGILARVDPDQFDKLLDSTCAEPAIMRGSIMTGWVRVAGDDLTTKRKLERWVNRSVSHVRTLPPKKR